MITVQWSPCAIETHYNTEKPQVALLDERIRWLSSPCLPYFRARGLGTTLGSNRLLSILFRPFDQLTSFDFPKPNL